jgi:hypothetical protein
MLKSMVHAAARVLALTGVLLHAAGCPGGSTPQDPPPPRETIPSPPPPPPTAGSDAADPEAGSRRARLLAWLDPDAISVAYSRMPERLRADAVAVVYGLPPRAEELLRAIADVDEALEAVRPTDAPATGTWLASEALVTAGRLSRRPLVLRPLLVPKAEAIARLEALGLERQEVDAFEVWQPRRVLPYRVVLLDGDVAGFIPMSEPGTGLPPLVSARDMPPSEVETQLDALLAVPDGLAVALLAAGPMIHLDVDQDVMSVRFELRRAKDGSLDGQLALQVDGEPGPVAAALEGRKAPEQSDAIQRLVERAAYGAEGPIVAGRLQLSPADAALLEAEP